MNKSSSIFFLSALSLACFESLGTSAMRVSTRASKLNHYFVTSILVVIVLLTFLLLSDRSAHNGLQ